MLLAEFKLYLHFKGILWGEGKGQKNKFWQGEKSLFCLVAKHRRDFKQFDNNSPKNLNKNTLNLKNWSSQLLFFNPENVSFVFRANSPKPTEPEL